MTDNLRHLHIVYKNVQNFIDVLPILLELLHLQNLLTDKVILIETFMKDYGKNLQNYNSCWVELHTIDTISKGIFGMHKIALPIGLN